MGITGLLRVLDPITETRHLSEFRGKRAVVDAFCWLHRASYCCALELLSNKPTLKYIDFCMHMVDLLRAHGVTPIIVFDGGKLPMKSQEEKNRAKTRDDAQKKATEALKVNDLSTAVKFSQRAVRITRVMTRTFIQALKDSGVEFLVSPYEADAQMAYMVRTGLADFCISEDSDMLVFGTGKVLFKLDKVGNGRYVDMTTVQSYTPPPLPKKKFGQRKKKRSGAEEFVRVLKRFSDTDFQRTCILSGCDYLPSLPGVGLSTALGLIKSHKLLKRVFYFLKIRKKKGKMPADYKDNFTRAELTFRYQRVYDPRTCQVTTLNPMPEPTGDTQSESTGDGEDSGNTKPVESEFPDSLKKPYNFLGPPLSPENARRLAEGDLDPRSMTAYTNPIPVRWKARGRRFVQPVAPSLFPPREEPVVTAFKVTSAEESANSGAGHTVKKDPVIPKRDLHFNIDSILSIYSVRKQRSNNPPTSSKVTVFKGTTSARSGDTPGSFNQFKFHKAKPSMQARHVDFSEMCAGSRSAHKDEDDPTTSSAESPRENTSAVGDFLDSVDPEQLADWQEAIYLEGNDDYDELPDEMDDDLNISRTDSVVSRSDSVISRSDSVTSRSDSVISRSDSGLSSGKDSSPGKDENMNVNLDLVDELSRSNDSLNFSVATPSKSSQQSAFIYPPDSPAPTHNLFGQSGSTPESHKPSRFQFNSNSNSNKISPVKKSPYFGKSENDENQPVSNRTSQSSQSVRSTSRSKMGRGFVKPLSKRKRARGFSTSRLKKKKSLKSSHGSRKIHDFFQKSGKS
eukprot:397076_1